MSTWREALKAGEEMLVRAGVPDGAYDAWALMEFAFAMEKVTIFSMQMIKWKKNKGNGIRKFLKSEPRGFPCSRLPVPPGLWAMSFM